MESAVAESLNELELLMKNAGHWYDYENQKALRLPPAGEVVEFLCGGVSYGEVEFICRRGNNAVYWMISRDTVDSAVLPTAEFRPLDWNKQSARNELAQLIESHGNLPSGLLADSILAAGYRKCDNKTPSTQE